MQQSRRHIRLQNWHHVGPSVVRTEVRLAGSLLKSHTEDMHDMDSDLIRRQALYELMAVPDPPDLRRGFIRVLDGKPDRHAQLPLLAAKFVQARLLEIRERVPIAEEVAVS
jgi:hypothetical protein